MSCVNCNNENKKKTIKCEFCGNSICRECAGMSLCQNCYKNGCNRCLESCPNCLEMFCKMCIDSHINSELHLTDKLNKNIDEVSQSNLSDNLKSLIIEKMNKKWFL